MRPSRPHISCNDSLQEGTCCEDRFLIQEKFREGVILKICVLASGSSGNCTFFSTGRTRLLVDAGLSCRETFRRLTAIGEDPEKLDAILISHEHGDHVSSLPTLARKLSIPVYLSQKTAPTIVWNGCEAIVQAFQAGKQISIGDLDICTFTVPHDAVDPVGFTFHSQGLKIALVTDLGYIPESVKYHLRAVDVLILESNHDLEMLKVGPYPWSVKQRVMSRNGHLSNEVVSEFIRCDMDSSTSTLVLGHLSANNNHPALVRMVCGEAIASRHLGTRLVVAEPRSQTEVFTL